MRARKRAVGVRSVRGSHGGGWGSENLDDSRWRRGLGAEVCAGLVVLRQLEPN